MEYVVIFLCSLNSSYQTWVQGNIFIDDSGAAQVADFGIAVVGDETAGRFTTTANSAGVIRWMAPERLDPETSSERLSPAGDVWAFACLCLMVRILALI
jgi:serine/threonine protein kinase